jgi:hypothetical protein
MPDLRAGWPGHGELAAEGKGRRGLVLCMLLFCMCALFCWLPEEEKEREERERKEEREGEKSGFFSNLEITGEKNKW